MIRQRWFADLVGTSQHPGWSRRGRGIHQSLKKQPCLLLSSPWQPTSYKGKKQNVWILWSFLDLQASFTIVSCIFWSTYATYIVYFRGGVLWRDVGVTENFYRASYIQIRDIMLIASHSRLFQQGICQGFNWDYMGEGLKCSRHTWVYSSPIWFLIFNVFFTMFNLYYK